MSNSKRSIKENILKILEKHPEGLTILNISSLVGAHRHTVTKYVYELIGSGKIVKRQIGSAKLCYLKRNLKRQNNGS